MLTKIKILLEKANGKLKELHEWCIEHYFISMLIPLITLLLVFYPLMWNWSTNRSKITVVTGGVTQETVDRVMGNKENEVYKEITEIKKLEEAEQLSKDLKSHQTLNSSTVKLDKRYDRTYFTPEESTKENIDKELERRDGDKVIVDKESNVKPGTTIYSIKNIKKTVGLGVYVGYNEGVGKSYGVHYRNNRMTYQVGVDGDNHLEGRVAYELIQW